MSNFFPVGILRQKIMLCGLINDPQKFYLYLLHLNILKRWICKLNILHLRKVPESFHFFLQKTSWSLYSTGHVALGKCFLQG